MSALKYIVMSSVVEVSPKCGGTQGRDLLILPWGNGEDATEEVMFGHHLKE